MTVSFAVTVDGLLWHSLWCPLTMDAAMSLMGQTDAILYYSMGRSRERGLASAYHRPFGSETSANGYRKQL